MEQDKDIHIIKNKEYIVTNGIGGYSSSSLCGMNTRRYHGLLIASLNPPVERFVVVSKIDETIVTNAGDTIEISTNQYPGTIHPGGYMHQHSFTRSPLPAFIYNAGEGIRIEKKICMVQRSNTVIVKYANLGTDGLTLRLNPLFVLRDYHSLNQESSADSYSSAMSGDTVLSVQHPRFPAAVYCRISKGLFETRKETYFNVEYFQEQERGFDFSENMFSAGFFTVKIEAGKSVHLVFSLEKQLLDEDPAALIDTEILRLQQIAVTEKNKFLKDLIVSGNQFIIDRKSTNHKSIIAGYHWFTDWGRDTMIAMRGLTIATGDKEVSESILTSFLANLSEGMLPNRFSDKDELPEYNTADATLWMFVVLYEYFEKFNDISYIKKYFGHLKEIIEAHIQGTRYNIKVNEDGMLYAGEDGVQVTWMDAKVGDFVVTPRIGYTVELNMLWYNTLKIFDFFCKQLNDSSLEVEAYINKIETNFHRYFWNEYSFLNDVITAASTADQSFRPNQVYAISLPFTMLNEMERKMVLHSIKDKLLTGYGLRSLSQDHEKFIAAYKGDSLQRDTAYHQGTVWAFLLPEFCLGWLQQNKYSKAAIKEVQQWVAPLEEHFYNDNGISAISEIFDGLNPGDGKGCIQQAWSVGMMIKLLKDISINKN
jgi:predicted glycogen debranching enzyme